MHMEDAVGVQVQPVTVDVLPMDSVLPLDMLLPMTDIDTLEGTPTMSMRAASEGPPFGPSSTALFIDTIDTSVDRPTQSEPKMLTQRDGVVDLTDDGCSGKQCSGPRHDEMQHPEQDGKNNEETYVRPLSLEWLHDMTTEEARFMLRSIPGMLIPCIR